MPRSIRESLESQPLSGLVLSTLLQDQLRRKPRAAAHRASFHELRGGAYNEALKSFARAVCGLPEVRCVTYAKLADFMDQQNAETLAAYRKGDFARAATPALNVAEVLR